MLSILWVLGPEQAHMPGRALPLAQLGNSYPSLEPQAQHRLLCGAFPDAGANPEAA